MKISCIIAVRDGMPFLTKALDSIATQSICPFEVLVIDDGSTDASVECARGHALCPTVLPTQGRGPAGARNTALGVVRGDLITFLDADDIWRPHKLERQVEAFVRWPDLDLCLVAAENFADPPCTIPGDWRLPLLGRHSGEFLLSTAMARSSLFDRVGLFDETLFPWGEDTDWFLRVVTARACFRHLDEVFVNRRLHTRNLIRDFANSQRINTAFTLVARDLARRRSASK
ncbi:putative Glycosyltransferase [Gammaproteobacteria bacterium]